MKGSTAVQNRLREQTSERTRDRAELSWETVRAGGIVKNHEMGDGGEPCDLEPRNATKDQATGLSLYRLIHSPSPSMSAACSAQSWGKGRAWLWS